MRFIEETWSSEKLGNLCKITMGQSPSSKNYSKNSNDTILIQGNADLISGKIVPRIYTSEITKLSYPGDIILTVRAPVGDLAINEFDSCIGRGVCSIKGNKFIYYYLESLKDKHVWERLSQGSTFESVNSNDIKNLNLKIPSNSTQNHIINFFTAIDTKIELLQKKHGEYIRFKQYLMQNIFADKSAEKLRFDFNDEWKNIPFKKLLKEVNEKTTVNNQHEILSSTKEGIFTQKDYFADRNVASKDNTGYKVLRKNQIVLSPQNLWMGNINVNTEFDIGIVSPSYKIYETTDLIDINYFKHIVKLPRLIYEYTCASEQGASIVRRNLNKQLFNEITIKVPSLNEQKKIGNLFDTCDEKIKNIDKNIQDMKEFKKGLLQQMFVVRINWRCNFKLAKSPSFNKHLLILKNKIIFIIIK